MRSSRRGLCGTLPGRGLSPVLATAGGLAGVSASPWRARRGGAR